MKPVIALTKGRLEKQFIKYLQQRGYDVEPLIDKGRKLQVETEKFNAIFAKGVDVGTYVEHGIADMGIIGEDILLEFAPDVFDVLAFPFGQCRFAIAGEPHNEPIVRKQKIATKYPNITTKYFRDKGKSIDIVKLEGSVELAPLLGLADDIVDIVETGNTLKENGLIVKEDMFTLTARCIVNRNYLKLKREALSPLIEMFRTKEVVK